MTTIAPPRGYDWSFVGLTVHSLVMIRNVRDLRERHPRGRSVRARDPRIRRPRKRTARLIRPSRSLSNTGYVVCQKCA
jgi:hypothetical protein